MVVEWAFGDWKRRFRCLQTTMAEKSMEQTVGVAVSTLVLHNLFQQLNDDLYTIAASPCWGDREENQVGSYAPDRNTRVIAKSKERHHHYYFRLAQVTFE